jgi:antitoxin (DNA-binding transcriptional repressor) of toxin-antitoxin stability system
VERVDIDGMTPELADLVGRAEQGESVEFVRDGKVIARLATAGEPPRKAKVDVAMLEALAARLPFQQQSAGEFIREMRDDERY